MKRKGLLLDRDGVINIDRGYVGMREQFEFTSGIFSFLGAMQDAGFRLAILTNQSGVARGLYTAADYRKLTAWMLNEFAKQGIIIDLVLACFELKEGTVAEYRRDSFWRKPNPGMVLEAIQRLNLDPLRSAFLGDNERDMLAAKASGIATCLYLTDKEVPKWAKKVKNLQEATELLMATGVSPAS
jgi:D-glycero-D-manno-heptose 1,7-bisphosphate phosphatase